MAATMNPGWTKPSTILFASEVPANEKAFELALGQAKEFGANLIVFHANNILVVSSMDASGVRDYDFMAAAHIETQHLQPLAQRGLDEGLRCEVVVRPGLPAEQILAYALERSVDRIVMGTRSPGPVGKLLVGSVAEEVLRTSPTPVYIIGPEVVSGEYRTHATRTVLCAVSMHESSSIVATFAAELAAQHDARLILQYVVQPQDRAELLSGLTLDGLEADLLALVPAELHESVGIQTIVVPGDRTEELLYQSRAQHVDLIVLGAHDASAFAAITRHGVVYKTLTQALCPVITLSPVVLAQGDAKADGRSSEQYTAGVI